MPKRLIFHILIFLSRFGANQITFNISDNAVNNIYMEYGKNPNNMQVFQCYCPTANVKW